MYIRDVKENIFQTVHKRSYPVDLNSKGYLIFYESEGYHLSEKQYETFMDFFKNSNILGEIFNIDIEFIDDIEDNEIEVKETSEFGHEVRDLTKFDYDKYQNIQLLFENCLIDKDLRWSICVYQDYWGILYAPKNLLDKVVNMYDFKADLENFKEDISDIKNEKVKKEFEELIQSSYISIGSFNHLLNL